ncbi:hypothetical protein T439DRAFT_381502 [Meredithblackwellia eburnea MCA 4105]
MNPFNNQQGHHGQHLPTRRLADHSQHSGDRSDAERRFDDHNSHVMMQENSGAGDLGSMSDDEDDMNTSSVHTHTGLTDLPNETLDEIAPILFRHADRSIQHLASTNHQLLNWFEGSFAAKPVMVLKGHHMMIEAFRIASYYHMLFERLPSAKNIELDGPKFGLTTRSLRSSNTSSVRLLPQNVVGFMKHWNNQALESLSMRPDPTTWEQGGVLDFANLGQAPKLHHFNLMTQLSPVYINTLNAKVIAIHHVKRSSDHNLQLVSWSLTPNVTELHLRANFTSFLKFCEFTFYKNEKKYKDHNHSCGKNIATLAVSDQPVREVMQNMTSDHVKRFLENFVPFVPGLAELSVPFGWIFTLIFHTGQEDDVNSAIFQNAIKSLVNLKKLHFDDYTPHRSGYPGDNGVEASHLFARAIQLSHIVEEGREVSFRLSLECDSDTEQGKENHTWANTFVSEFNWNLPRVHHIKQIKLYNYHEGQGRRTHFFLKHQPEIGRPSYDFLESVLDQKHAPSEPLFDGLL